MSGPLTRPATELEIVPVEAGDPGWDRFVAESPGGTFCHLLGWRRIMEESLGRETLYRAAVDPDGTWRGVLPLVRVRSRLIGHYLVSMPFLNYGGPLGDPAAQRRLAAWAVDEARSSGAEILELRSRHDLPADAPVDVEAHKVTVLLDLPEDRDELFKERFPSKLRSQIRRPMKEGMEAKIGADQLGPFYEVFGRNMRDLGTPVLPRSSFEQMAETLGDQVVFAAVYHEDKAVAGACGFLWQGEFEITWASALREYNRLAPNMLLYWSLMEEMIRRGAHTFNFGRCTPGEGTHRFKRQWGGEDAPLPWGLWSPTGSRSTPKPDEGLYRHAVRAWQRLPVPVTNRIGPFLARRIP